MASSPDSKPVDLFYSYAHEDEPHRKKLENHLATLKRQGMIEGWHDRRISAGREWEGAIDSNLEASDIILLLVSDDFLASDYCYDKEMKRALEKHERGEARVIPIIVRAVDWSGAPFAKLQALPKDGKPVTSWSNQDEAWTDVALSIRGVAQEIIDQEIIANPSAASSTIEGTELRRPWNVPPKNRLFTGRKEFLERIHSLLSVGELEDGQCLAICGLGGVGKTQTAIEYAYRYSNEYKTVLWTGADTHEALLSGFAAIAGVLGLPSAEDQKLLVEAVKRWLANNKDWLLILDNADDPELIEDFLPESFQGKVLLTSRSQIYDELELVEAIELEKMSPQDAKQFLLRRVGRTELGSSEDQAIEQLMEELDFLPLALEQAGAYINRIKCSFQDYLSSYRNRGLEVFKMRQSADKDDRRSVVTTWALNFEKVEQTSEAAADILRVSAFLHPDRIPLEIISLGAVEISSALSEALADVETHPLILDEVLEPLTHFSLIRRDPNTRTYDIHRLEQAVLRNRMDQEAQRAWAERTVKCVSRAFPEPEFPNWPLCERLIRHAKVCYDLIREYDFDFEEAIRLLAFAGVYLQFRAVYSESESLLKTAITLTEKRKGGEDPEVAMNLARLVSLYAEQGRYDDAEPLLNRTLTILRSAEMPETENIASCLHDLAGFYRYMGKYTEAEPLLVKSLEIREMVLGPKHDKVALGLNNLAGLYYEQGKYAEAEPLLIRGLAIVENTLAPEHPYIAGLYNGMASIYRQQGKFHEAERFLLRSRDIIGKTFGANHTKMATSLNNLADLYVLQGKYADAEPLAIQSLEIIESIFGPDHPDIITVLNNLAHVYSLQGKNTKAEPLMRRALAIGKKILRPEHPTFLSILENLAGLLWKMNRKDEALKLSNQAKSIRNKTKKKKRSR